MYVRYHYKQVLRELTIVIRNISNQTLSGIDIFGSNLRADTREDITFRNVCNLVFAISFLDEEEWRTIALLPTPTAAVAACLDSKEHDDIIV